MKKKLFLVTCLFLLCAFFHKQILGAAVRYALEREWGCQLAYSSIAWEEGELVFSDLVLFDPTFHAHVEKVGVRFDWSSFPQKMKGHLSFKGPRVSLLKRRDLPEWSESWFDFTLSMSGGTIEWDGLAYFSLEHTGTETRLTLDWGESGLIAAIADGKIEADLRRFKAALLNPYLPMGEINGGGVSGRVQVGLDWQLISANLKVEQFGIALPLGSIEKTEGALSYNSNLGAKWELEGVGYAQGKSIPFVCSGRGFFKSHWVESEIRFAKSFFKISGEEFWKLECQDLQSAEATLLQACAAGFIPELASWTFAQGLLCGEGNFSGATWNAHFEGENLLLRKGNFELACLNAKGNLSQDGGELALAGENFDLKVGGVWTDWKAEGRLMSGSCRLKGGWDGEKFPVEVEKGAFEDFQFTGQGWIDPNFDFSFDLEGDWAVAQRKIPFYCPHFNKQGDDWAFDFRFARKTWDILRIAGTARNKEVIFSSKSHFLGVPLHFASCDLGAVNVDFKLPWKSLLAAGPFLQEWNLDLAKWPLLGDTDIHLQFAPGHIKATAEGSSLPFQFQAEQLAEGWKIDLVSDLSLNGWLKEDGTARGKVSWKEAIRLEFEGKISPSFHCEFSLPKVWCDLAQLDFHGMEGVLEGQGHLIYKGIIESDLDLTPSSLKINTHSLENEGPIHLAYSSTKGTLFQGVNLHGPLNCMVDLLEYDAIRAHWIFHNAQVYLPGSFLTHRFLKFLDKQRDLNFTADLDFASDFSTFICTMREGDIPFDDASHHIENLSLYWDKNECKAALHYLGHLHRLNFSIDDQIEGRLILGEEESPLTIDWEYQDNLEIRSIEGAFGGVDASFHAESPNTLIGSARVNFAALSRFLPADVAEVFDELKMGRGYELKGRLKIDRNTPHFQGILAGKQLELFGFQFRTLLAQVDLGPESIRITDVKISDTAGVMKIDEIHLEGKEEKPWTLSIPQLTILDLRPSLLQRPGGPVGPISPLVVRELHLTDFQGLLDDGKTYTAKGKLHFINSYKREETVFDIPANVLSRIVGIDLDLLIPVRGDLTFELKEGLFYLQELTNAFSEGERSEFFLEIDPPPTMDLDGNLKIFIKMKQFVLLKITESFLISIEGQLDDPQFHLQKKRFFGLM